MCTRATLAEVWPLFGLSIRTPRLEMRLPVGDEIVALGRLAARGIQPPGEPPFHSAWLNAGSPGAERGLLQQLYGDIARWSPDDWSLGLAAFVAGEPIGV